MEGNMLTNCPFNKVNILRIEEILGPNLGSLTGKMTRTTQSKVQINTLDDLPTKLLEHHRNVTLTIDIMHINKTIPFIITTSWAIDFGTAEMIKNGKNQQ